LSYQNKIGTALLTLSNVSPRHTSTQVDYTGSYNYFS